ncbi:RNA-directed DNA polymerase [Streptomyces sp. CB01881]|uniref:RNA-directed DNA polymerase n=1 Tax=Streptomyces sp. CB01881 TaxID=2078691 RepID=UPI0013868929|nr:RNA-directed DNA polymerase [Streptomyces sp. CB01881]
MDLAKRLLVPGRAGDQDYSAIPDVAGYADIQDQWLAGYRKTLLSSIRDGDCTPTYTEIIDYPKDSINFRPLARFSARDRIIYDALIYLVTPDIDRHLDRRVFSYRWDHQRREPHFWSKLWRQMQRVSRRHLEADPWPRMATLDAASFYEHVDIDILSDDLSCISKNRYDTQRLTRFLTAFQRINHAWGLPQGSDASAILANLYLTPVDEFLRKSGIPFARYSDDIRIFHPDWTELRDILGEINRILRSRRLSMSAQKTAILEQQDALTRIHDPRLASLSASCDIGIPGAQEEVRMYFDKAIKEEQLSQTAIRFALNRLVKLRDDHAVSWCLENLHYLPHISKELFRYLGACKSRAVEIKHELSLFMTSGASSSYPYLEQRILRYFLSAEERSPQLKDAAWMILEDRNREDFPREFAVRYLGRDASIGESQLLRHRFEDEPSIAMRRALLMALYESGNLSERYLNEVEEYLPPLKWVCRYLRTQPKIPIS